MTSQPQQAAEHTLDRSNEDSVLPRHAPQHDRRKPASRRPAGPSPPTPRSPKEARPLGCDSSHPGRGAFTGNGDVKLGGLAENLSADIGTREISLYGACRPVSFSAEHS